MNRHVGQASQRLRRSVPPRPVVGGMEPEPSRCDLPTVCMSALLLWVSQERRIRKTAEAGLQPQQNRIEAGRSVGANWIREPRAIKAITWMPRVCHNANSRGPEDAVRNEVEIDAVVAHLFANSEEHQPALRRPARGDPAPGRQLVESVGCLAFHVTGEESREISGPRRTFGQSLVGLGDKTSAALGAPGRPRRGTEPGASAERRRVSPDQGGWRPSNNLTSVT